MNTAKPPAEVTVVLTEAEHGRLAAQAEAHGLAASQLARALIVYGLSELGRDNSALERAVRISRDT